MALFNFGKSGEKEGKKLPKCSCQCGGAASEAGETTKADRGCCSGSRELQSVKVLGSGCKNCHALLENTGKALKTLGFSLEPEYVTDMAKIMEYGVMSMPALVVNEQVLSMGKVLNTSDIEKLLDKHGFIHG